MAVAVGKADLAIADIDETVIGDGHAMRVAPEIFNDVLRTLDEGTAYCPSPAPRTGDPLSLSSAGWPYRHRLLDPIPPGRRALSGPDACDDRNVSSHVDVQPCDL